MKRLSIFLFGLWLTAAASMAQTPRTTGKPGTTTAAKKPSTSTTAQTKKPTAATPVKAKTTQTATTKNASTAKKGTTQKKAAPKKPDQKTVLRNEVAATKQARAEEQKKAERLTGDIRVSLDSVVILSSQIKIQQKSVDSLNLDIYNLSQKISEMTVQLDKLQKELNEKKAKYAKAMVNYQRNNSIHDKLMFVFSSKNFEQMVRRMRYIREYSSYQKAQGELIVQQQKKVEEKKNQLASAKEKRQQSLNAVVVKKQGLENMKDSQQRKVEYLNNNLAAVKAQIAEYDKRELEINAQIEKIVQQEIAEAKRRAELERQRRAEAARKAAAEKARRAEEARKKAEAARIAREKREAEAKARAEAARKAAAEAAARKAAAEAAAKKAAAEAAAKKRAQDEAARKAAADAAAKAKAEADAARKAAADAAAKAKAEADAAKAEAAKAKAEAREAERRDRTENNTVSAYTSSEGVDSETRLSSNFASNKGRLPMPISGSYSIVGHYGTYNVSGLNNVTLDNKGIDIRGAEGACARAVFEGEVSSVFQYGATYIVMIRHGSYISVYSGLASVAVGKGTKVVQRQNLGRVGKDSSGNVTLHFQLRKESSRLNPEQWVR